MQQRYRMYRRNGGSFYVKDRISGKAESLGTANRAEAEQLLAAKNQSVAQPQLNRTMAKAYLSAKSPDLVTRSWAEVMDHYIKSGVESTRVRKARAFRSRPFSVLRTLALLDTEAIHLLAVLEHKKAGNSTHHYLRRIHNYALHLGWLLSPVMADAAWPEMRKKKMLAITKEEHLRLISRERNVERRLYYEMLWETGGSQSDIARLNSDRINLNQGIIVFSRQKLEGKGGGETCLTIGPRIRNLLDQLPQKGDLFPTVKAQPANNRAGYFRKACRACGINGKSLHSYRYAWAQRAMAAGMPERDAMNHLGHKSRAVHAAYAGAADVTVLPLEFYEEMKSKKILAFAQGQQAPVSEIKEISLHKSA